jgi:hypothetical protein
MFSRPPLPLAGLKRHSWLVNCSRKWGRMSYLEKRMRIAGFELSRGETRPSI